MSSLADRISKPENGESADIGLSNSSKQAPSPISPSAPKSWADEATSAAEASSAPPSVKANAEKEMNDLAKAQTDGAAEPLNGNAGVIEPSYDVDVKLSDMQANPNDPLYSAKSFEELGL